MGKAMNEKVVMARIPVALDFSPKICGAVEDVLKGEYESGYFGENLNILDIGANIGSFTLWANLRWPQSRIHAFEPHPETFKMLTNNVKALNNITCHNVAVYPSEKKLELFWSRFAGDGESGLVAYMEKTFQNLPQTQVIEVPILHPKELPEADIVKIDVEGGEVLVIENMNFNKVSLFLLEYQNIENREAIKNILEANFYLVHEDRHSWNALLSNPEYRKELKNDFYGRLFFINKQQDRLRKYCYKKCTELFGMSLRQICLGLPSPILQILASMRRIFSSHS
jgi:FkbM family methyltransferase